jgi:hypoxanthine phosphoribosyltransferase
MDNFKVMCSEKEIQKRIRELAEEVDEDYKAKGKQSIVMISVLKGAVFFSVDLMKRMELPVVYDTIQISNYVGTDDTQELKLKKDVDTNVEGKDVLLVEDIIDSGRTLNYLKQHLLEKGASDVKIAVLMDKKDKRQFDVNVDYAGFVIPDKFVLGYGFDMDEKYRNLPYIGYIE